MFIIYDFIYLLFSLLYFPYLFLKGKWHKDFPIRFGKFNQSLINTLGEKKNIWIHAVSVGEVLVVLQLVKKLKEKYPDCRIVFSTVTQTGQKLARENFSKDDVVIYAPLDFSWIVRKYINLIQPKIYIATETEIWPNLYTALYKKGVPIIQINGRISDKSFKGYKRVKFLTKKVLSCVTVFGMQSDLDKERIKELGADQRKIHVVGNIKFDYQPLKGVLNQTSLGFKNQDELFIAGSTHPGEEEIVINLYKELTKKFSNLRLVIAPRHIERASEVVNLIAQAGFTAVKFSESKDVQMTSEKMIVIDEIGHLAELYSLAKIVFIGKTLKVGGGQNMIEPCFYGKPTFVGPLTENFRDAVKILLSEKALIEVQDSKELFEQITVFLNNPEKLQSIGVAAKKTVEKYQGATNKTFELISKVLAV